LGEAPPSPPFATPLHPHLRLDPIQNHPSVDRLINFSTPANNLTSHFSRGGKNEPTEEPWDLTSENSNISMQQKFTTYIKDKMAENKANTSKTLFRQIRIAKILTTRSLRELPEAFLMKRN